MPWAANQTATPDYYAVSVWPSLEELDEVVAGLYGFGVNGLQWDDGEVATVPFTDIPMPATKPFVRAFFPDDAAWPELRSQVEAWLQASLWSWDIEKVITEDWANTWKAYYLPITLEDGYSIIPAWRDDLKGNERTIWLDPGMAFGTGTHPTTEMCLRSIATIVPSPRKVLDLGAGSGILGIFAAKRYGVPVVAVEPDPVAVRSLKGNVARNALADRLSVVEGTLADVAVSQTFDLIVANIIAEVIIDEWSRMIGYLQPGGSILLSGIIVDRLLEVRKSIEATPHHIVRQEISGMWALLVVR